MNPGRIIIISGAPGSGKSSTARLLAENSSHERAAHMHTDDFYAFIRKGYILPWLPEAKEQNIAVMEAFIASASRLAQGGYEVFVDGVIGPWFVKLWMDAVRAGFDVRYVVLRPSEDTTVARASARQGEGDLTDPEVVRYMWRGFADLGIYEPHAIDTSNQSIEESVAAVERAVEAGGMRLATIDDL